MDDGSVWGIIGEYIPSIKDVVSLSACSKSIRCGIESNERIGKAFCRRINATMAKPNLLENNKFENVHSKICVTADNYLNQFIVIYRKLDPLLKDLIFDNYKNFNQSAVFVDYTSPEIQSRILVNLLQFSNYYKFDPPRYSKISIRLHSIVEIFVSSVMSEVEIGLRKKDFAKVSRFLDILISLERNVDLILEIFLDNYSKEYDFIKEVKAEDFLQSGYVEELTDRVAVCLNSQFNQIDQVFSVRSTENNNLEVSIVLKLLETFISSLGLDELVNGMKQEGSLFQTALPEFYVKISQKIREMEFFHRNQLGFDFGEMSMKLVNFQFDPHLLDYTQMLSEETSFQVEQDILLFNQDKEKKQDETKNQILNTQKEDIEQSGNFLNLFNNITNIFKKDQDAPSKHANLQLFLSNMRNLNSLLDIDLVCLILGKLNHFLQLLLNLGRVSGEIHMQFEKTTQSTFIQYLDKIISLHVNPGFQEALDYLKHYNPQMLKTHPEENNFVEPLVKFIDLVKSADFIIKILKIFYDNELVGRNFISAPKKQKDFLSLNQCEKSINSLETLVDNYIAEGLNISIDVLLNEISFIILQHLDDSNYNLSLQESDKDLSSPSVLALQCKNLLSTHFTILEDSIDKAILQVFQEEIGERFINILVKIITKNLIISTTGAIQLISDLQCFIHFFEQYKQKKIVQNLNVLKKVSTLYLVDKSNAKELGKIVVKLGKNNGFYTQEEIYEFVTRRTDWSEIKPRVDKVLYGLNLADCMIV